MGKSVAIARLQSILLRIIGLRIKPLTLSRPVAKNYNYSADTRYFHGTRMTPMGRILTDLLSVFCGPAIDEETLFIRACQSNPCHPCSIF
jgi:hypothetical protein